MQKAVQLATLGYIRSEEHVLMLHRNLRLDDVHYGKWNGVGGKLQEGESPDACFKREVKEEAGLTVASPELRGVLTFPAFTPHTDWYVFVFLVDEFSRRPEVDGSSNNEGTLHWVSQHELLSLSLWEGDQIFLPKVFEGPLFFGTFSYEAGRLQDYTMTP